MAEDNGVFDAIVVGAGPVGETAAARIARGGLTVAVVEKRLAGGECQYYGCVPSKALLRPMGLAAEVGRMPGLELRGPIDTAAVLARRDKVVFHLDDSSEVSRIENFPATFIRGQGRLAGPLRVEVTHDRRRRPDVASPVRRRRRDGHRPRDPRRARATGSTAVDEPGGDQRSRVPNRLVVIGGGPVGCEMSQALHFLGAQDTTLLVRGDRLLPQAEPFAGELLASSFQESGIDVRFGRSARPRGTADSRWPGDRPR